jgi:hypothetical protein
MTQDRLILKWGTWKAMDIKSAAGLAALEAYNDAGPQCASAMMQRETPAQQEALCALIDAVDCETIGNDWTGENMTKDEAKRYVMESR